MSMPFLLFHLGIPFPKCDLLRVRELLNEKGAKMSRVRVDPGTVEIIRNALLSIAMQMKATIIRSAYFSTIQEAQDFSVALFERDRLIAQGIQARNSSKGSYKLAG
jgi:hypothetical protein